MSNLFTLFSQGYKVYYTTSPHLPLSQWESQFVDNNKLTTISDLTPHTIYTIRVEAYTAVGPGPPSQPVQVWRRRSKHYQLSSTGPPKKYLNKVLKRDSFFACVPCFFFYLSTPWFKFHRSPKY